MPGLSRQAGCSRETTRRGTAQLSNQCGMCQGDHRHVARASSRFAIRWASTAAAPISPGSSSRASTREPHVRRHPYLRSSPAPRCSPVVVAALSPRSSSPASVLPSEAPRSNTVIAFKPPARSLASPYSCSAPSILASCVCAPRRDSIGNPHVSRMTDREPVERPFRVGNSHVLLCTDAAGGRLHSLPSGAAPRHPRHTCEPNARRTPHEDTMELWSRGNRFVMRESPFRTTTGEDPTTVITRSLPPHAVLALLFSRYPRRLRIATSRRVVALDGMDLGRTG